MRTRRPRGSRICELIADVHTLRDICIANNVYGRFCTCLDGSKTGLIVKQKVMDEDSKKYNRRPPAWAETSDEAASFAAFGSNDLHPSRPDNLHAFIMDTLRREANKSMNKYLSYYEMKTGNGLSSGSSSGSRGRVDVSVKDGRTQSLQAQPYDADLVAIYDRVRVNAEHLVSIGQPQKLEELNKIKSHVEDVRKLHRGQIGQYSPRKNGKKSGQKGAGFTDLSIQTRQDTLRALSRRFASGPKVSLTFFCSVLVRYAACHNLR